jgi:hypothetical protein
MAHIHTITRKPAPAQDTGGIGRTTAIESIILVVISVIFRGWDNFQAVSTNLSKYFSKTP